MRIAATWGVVLSLAVALGARTPPLAAQASPPSLSRPIQYHNPDWSPDGTRVLFESTLSGKYSIYRIDAGGTGLTQLTPDTANNEQARWSPDGRRIVFSSDRAGHLDLYLMNADGSAQTRLTVTPGGGYYGASFSPDGRWILFQGRPDNAEVRDRVYLIASSGSGMRQLSDSTYGAESPQWSDGGRTISFRQVPYPKRFWAEMLPGDVAAANAGARQVTLRPDGTGLVTSVHTPARVVRVRRFADSSGADGVRLSPDGRRFVYTRAVDGWAGVYRYDLATHIERLLTGGPGAGPLGYLRTASLTAGSDTLDTFGSSRSGGPITPGDGAYVVRSIRPAGGRRWEVSDSWYDSTGALTARQSMRTARGSLAIELESVRAPGDSATLLITPEHVTGWVVPKDRPPHVFDGASTSERFGAAVVAMAIAKAHPAIDALFRAPQHSLYGPDPVAIRIDSLRVVRRDTLYRGSSPLPVLVIERSGGGQIWVEEGTGAEVLSRGNAGPGRWWWHIRRGVRPPAIR